MVEPADRPSTAGQRLGAPESFGVSTLEPGRRPPAQPPGRLVSIRVQMLDDTQEVFQISQRSPGKVLFDLVCTHLNLSEGDYFGLEYQDQRKMTVVIVFDVVFADWHSVLFFNNKNSNESIFYLYSIFQITHTFCIVIL
uniref:FERM domain-containing protein n=1 Tax=Acanthochromis polyacanthus TaxID=80966 RepID=A0A3Q1FMV2_9TELE